MTDASSRMTSHRPYLLRALNEWIADNGMTPHLLVDATQAGVQVPASAVKEGKVVLNIAERAVVRLMIDNDAVSFTARFGGVSQPVYVPISAVLAIYSRETGQGMALPEDVTHDADTGEESGDDAPTTDTPPDDHTPPPGGKRPPFLRVVK
ncbi:ClpXP protease specificity-enhancing factor [Pseudoxanthomonas mexicana]|mgnify:FL=1|jgi:stringent starvation protein B|uniref:ClpXP protease specificity-enhancing factor n=1 Tax=Pseudoxanthomonas mexicana TaxID=128785 RepID=UPI001FD65B83|nr:ClpXP protease specificity-enhancing factor [Pseudoxanthomonas mexicana]UOV02442.1 ClpXP protease specificity-enhancing factor [Pseudoxanthomonas mexicana]HMM24357.1 ClpXP protease specificity-enhancing factor [Pseudoxanthomonas mexicana]